MDSPQTTHEAETTAANMPFVSRWNHLVSTTNWEKGRIIFEWRQALVAEDALVQQYSDERWSELVGGVSSQHVGRLRRVYERFTDQRETYPGLYWSHFAAALDWDDAEMWLEGAVHDGWSVAAMRATRSETLQLTEAPPDPNDELLAAANGDDPGTEDAAPLVLDDNTVPLESPAAASASSAGVESEGSAAVDFLGDVITEGLDQASLTEGDADLGVAAVQLVNLDELPDDLRDAFESFKLAILRHKMSGWREIAVAEVLTALDALKQLALAPAAS
mgnify:CR=1 FL=1